MNVDVVRNHLRRDEENRARRHPDVPDTMMSVAELALMESACYFPSERFEVVRPACAQNSKSMREVHRYVAFGKWLRAREPADRSHVITTVGLGLVRKIREVHEPSNALAVQRRRAAPPAASASWAARSGCRTANECRRYAW